MDFLPNYTKPLPDETLFSWILRLARSNGLTIETFSHIYCGIKGKASIRPYLTRGFPELYKHLPFVSDMKSLFLSTSIMNFDLLSRTPSRQIQYCNAFLWPTDDLNTKLYLGRSSVKICPECMKEDIQAYGKPYFHRSHQLQGACVCYKHHVPLLSYNGTQKKEIGFDIDDYTEYQSSFPIEDSVAYAEYVQDLLRNNIHTDEAAVKDAVEIRLNELGMDTFKIQDLFIPYIQKWEHKALMEPYNYQIFFEQGLRPLKNVSMPSLIPVIMCLWPDPKDFLTAVNDHEPILEEYVCQECGHTYLATPQSQRDGWGCPYCMQNVSIQERFDRLVQTKGNGEYECCTPFVSLGTKITLKHTRCGRDFITTPSKFLFFDQKCSCHKNYSPYGYKNFSYIRPKPKSKDYTKQIKDLVGNEYTIIGRCPDNPHKIILKHMTCGHVQEYYISQFLNGARCKYCTEHVNHIDLMEMLDEFSHGRYEIVKLADQYVMIYDATTQQEFKITAQKIFQELKRPTPSPYLPLDQEWDSSGWVPYWEKMLAEFKTRLSQTSLDSIICESDDLFGQWLRGQLKKWENGKLSDERIRDLSEIAPHLQDYIPFFGIKDNKKWMKAFERYKEYFSYHDEVYYDTKYKGHCVGTWEAHQKEADQKGRLSRHRHDLLLSVNPHIFDL